MSILKKFEDLKLWQKAKELSQKIYPLTFSEPIHPDFKFRDQLQFIICLNSSIGKA